MGLCNRQGLLPLFEQVESREGGGCLVDLRHVQPTGSNVPADGESSSSPSAPGGGRHRRSLQFSAALSGQQTCTPAEFQARVEGLDLECCDADDANFNCDSGLPQFCSVTCAKTYLPFFNQC
eukprot:SAG31_NODE_8595_length_1423_cov_1.577039_1_plen_121_part_10